MTITKENYKTLVWDESIPHTEYFDFIETLSIEEKVVFLKFLLVHYPAYDEEWVDYYFDINSDWSNNGNWEALNEFTDFVREKSPENYKKHFQYLDTEPCLHALFKEDSALLKTRFAASVADADIAIDTSFKTVFNVLSIDAAYKEYATEVAEIVWKPLAESPRLIGGAEFDYVTYLYSNYVEAAFDKIQKGEPVDWGLFTEKVEAVNFKFVKEFAALPNIELSIDFTSFHKNENYRNEQLNSIVVDFFYYAHTTLGIPVYWAFRSWLMLRDYMLDHEDAPKRTNWFAFTPKMIDRMLGRLNGFLSGNHTEMFIVAWTIPYIYDYFRAKNYIDAPTYARLLEYYEFVRRALLKIGNNGLWKYEGLYSWKKPSYLSAATYEQEQALFQQSISWTTEEGKKAVTDYIATLPELPSYVVPPEVPSPFERMRSRRSDDTDFFGKIGGGGWGGSNSGSTRKLRKKKKRKKKHKDNRKRGAKKKK